MQTNDLKILTQQHEKIFDKIKLVLHNKASKMRLNDPHCEVEDFRSRAYEILQRLEKRLGSLIITKDLTASGAEELYDPDVHSEKMLLDTVCKYLVKSFVHLQIANIGKQTKTLLTDDNALEYLSNIPSGTYENLVSTQEILSKIKIDISHIDSVSVQALTQFHFLTALEKTITQIEAEFDLKYIAKVENNSLHFSRSFFFVLWKILPQSILCQKEKAENVLIERQLNKIANSEHALKQRVFRYFREYKGGMHKRLKQ